MDVDPFLAQLRRDRRYDGQIVAHHRLPGRRARRAVLDPPPPPLVAEALARVGVDALYAHQVEAITAARAGRDVAVVTGTASGKTLCYNLPVVETLLADRTARALYLFPLKALAADQQRQLAALGLWREVRAATYDGDTSDADRRNPLALEVLDRDTGRVVRHAKLDANYWRMVACRPARLLLLIGARAALALDDWGEVVWQWSGPEIATEFGALGQVLGWGAAQRLLYLEAYHRRKGGCVVALDPRTGRPTGNQRPPTHDYTIVAMSPGCRVLACLTAGGLAMVDWVTGELRFEHLEGHQERGQPVRAQPHDSLCASDQPARIAAALNTGDTVYDRYSRVVWCNDLALPAALPRRMAISPDGRRLSVSIPRQAFWSELRPTIDTIVVYELPPDGDTAPRLPPIKEPDR
jgi:hypothetical protein